MNIKPPSSSHVVLDPRLLGRPVHLLPRFADRLRGDLAERLHASMNRRYRAAFGVEHVDIRCLDAPGVAGRWLRHESAAGAIGFAIDRALLLGALHFRYGADVNGAPAASASPPARETSTEERLGAMLGLQMVNTLTDCIDAGQDGTAQERECRAVAPCAPPPANTWTIRARIAEATLGIVGDLWFALDDAWMARLLRHLGGARERPRDPTGEDAGEPLARRVQLTLTGRLLRTDLPLGKVLDIQVGDVLPVSLGPTDVLVDDARLFKAVVAEHAGKLFLTSFEDAE